MNVILPAWDIHLAKQITPNATLDSLNELVERMLAAERVKKEISQRNEALCNALLEITTIENIPEQIMTQVTQGQYDNYLKTLDPSVSSLELYYLIYLFAF